MDKIKTKVLLAIIGLFALGGFVISAVIYHLVLDIRYQTPATEYTVVEPDSVHQKEIVYFGVISRYSPQIIYKGYQPVMDYLTENSDYKFELRLSASYDETVRQLAEGVVDAAFLGSYIYVRDRKKYDLKCILKPLNEKGQPFFHSTLITADTSGIFSIADLKSKRLALPSTESFSGNWLPLMEFEKYNLSCNDLAQIRHFPYHHNVADQILMGKFDAGVVKDRVAMEYINQGIRIIALSDPVPGSPIVVRKNHDEQIVKVINDILLNIDPRQSILKDWDNELSHGFVPARDSDYDWLDSIIYQEHSND